jgi:predicted nucleic acid-binding protein
VKPSRLAVDTNVLLDIADEADDVLDAADVIAGRLPDAEQLVTPRVLEELLTAPVIATPREIVRKFFR